MSDTCVTVSTHRSTEIRRPRHAGPQRVRRGTARNGGGNPKHNIWGLSLEGVPVYSGWTRSKSGGTGTHVVDWGRSAAQAEERSMNFDTESIDGYAVPVDPMDLLQCDSCQ